MKKLSERLRQAAQFVFQGELYDLLIEAHMAFSALKDIYQQGYLDGMEKRFHEDDPRYQDLNPKKCSDED